MNKKTTSGISLVALIVTIIVLIILTAAVIVTFMEGGIIEKAKEAVFKSDIRTYQEILAVKNAEKQIDLATGNGEGGLYNADNLAEIQAIIPGFKEEYKDLIVISNGEIILGSRDENPYRDWLLDLGIGNGLSQNAIANKVKVGEYVAYKPYQSNTFEEKSYLLKAIDSGFWDDSGEAEGIKYGDEEYLDQTINRQNINWRVLKNDNGQVVLISEEPIDTIGFGGVNAYLNGPDLLDDIYDNLYSSSNGIARNLRIEDINEIMRPGFDGNDRNNWRYWDSSCNITPLPEGTSTVGEVQTAVDSYRIVSDRLVGGKSIFDYPANYYEYIGSEYITEENAEAYNLIYKDFENIDNYSRQYWLSSSCIVLSWCDDCLFFFLRTIMDDRNLGGNGNYFVVDDENLMSLPGRPIVILNSDVELSSTNTGDGTSAQKAWQLK